MTTASAFRLIPIEEIHESIHNPRRHFDPHALEQLADSIRKVGVLTPALVRPNGQGYELAAGHRRYRASLLAGLTQLPCLVREMDDQAFMETLTVENLQREDVHPLDEAKGYEALMAAPYRMDVQKIADRVGRSVKYIYDRVKLLALCDEGQQLFWDGKIETGHAILLARLTVDEQKRVIGNQEEALNFVAGGLFQAEHVLFDSEEEEEQACEQGGPLKAVSVRELDRYIKQHIRFNARQADPFLFPETIEKVGEATQAKIKLIEITREYRPDDAVQKDGGARVYGERAWRRADGKEGSKTCDRSVLGVVSCGPGQGEAFFVCINKEKCAIHWGAEIRAREKNAKLSDEIEKLKPGAAASANKAAADKEQQRRQAEKRKYEIEQALRTRWENAQPKIARAVIDRAKTLPTKPEGYLAGLIVNHITEDGRFKIPGLTRGKSLEDLIRYLGTALLVQALDGWRAFEEFPKVAQHLGVDLSPILLAGTDSARMPKDEYDALVKLCGKKPEPAEKKKRLVKVPVQTSAPKGKKRKKAA